MYLGVPATPGTPLNPFRSAPVRGSGAQNDQDQLIRPGTARVRPDRQQHADRGVLYLVYLALEANLLWGPQPFSR
jgi:hypothetical protein